MQNKKMKGIRIRAGIKGLEDAAISEDIVIIVDVLRASSTIITALNNGASSVVPASTISMARRLAKATPNSILAGERKGLRIPRFALGNSPLEYIPEVVTGKNIILTTTNCTRILERFAQLSSRSETIIGAFLNATAIAESARKLAFYQDKRISIVQAGGGGKSSQDDLICAEILKTMIETGMGQRLTREAQDVAGLLLYSALSNTRHGRFLMKIGFNSDLNYCSQLGVTAAVPRLDKKSGAITKATGMYDNYCE